MDTVTTSCLENDAMQHFAQILSDCTIVRYGKKFWFEEEMEIQKFPCLRSV